MDEFDYLNKTLGEWLDDFVDHDMPLHEVLTEITVEYLPRFERAIHMNGSKKNGR